MDLPIRGTVGWCNRPENVNISEVLARMSFGKRRVINPSGIVGWRKTGSRAVHLVQGRASGAHGLHLNQRPMDTKYWSGESYRCRRKVMLTQGQLEYFVTIPWRLSTYWYKMFILDVIRHTSRCNWWVASIERSRDNDRILAPGPRSSKGADSGAPPIPGTGDGMQVIRNPRFDMLYTWRLTYHHVHLWHIITWINPHIITFTSPILISGEQDNIFPSHITSLQYTCAVFNSLAPTGSSRRTLSLYSIPLTADDMPAGNLSVVTIRRRT